MTVVHLIVTFGWVFIAGLLVLHLPPEIGRGLQGSGWTVGLVMTYSLWSAWFARKKSHPWREGAVGGICAAVLSLLVISFAGLKRLAPPADYYLDGPMYLYFLAVSGVVLVMYMAFTIHYLRRIRGRVGAGWGSISPISLDSPAWLPIVLSAPAFVVFPILNGEPLLSIVPLGIAGALSVIGDFGGMARRPLARSVASIWSDDRRFLILLFCFVLTTRAAFAVMISLPGRLPMPVLGGPDSGELHLISKNIAQGYSIFEPAFGWFVPDEKGEYTFQLDIGWKKVPKTPENKVVVKTWGYAKPYYILLVAGLYKLFGPHPIIPRLFQSLLAAVTVVLTYLIGRELFSPNVGKLAAVADAGQGWFLCHTVYIGPEAWGLFFMQLMVLGWLKAAKGPSEGRVGWLGLGAGASYGAGMMMRPEFSLFLPFFLIFASYTFLRRLRFVGAFVLGVFIVAVPWMGRNYIVHQKPLLLTVVQTKYNYKKDFGELEKIGVTFEGARHDLGRMVRHAPFVIRYLASKWWESSKRFWSWRTFFNVADFLFLAPFTAFAFTATLAVYGCLLIGLFQGWSVNPKSGVLYVLLGCFVFINSLPGPYYWHMYKVVPTLHIFEALGFLLLLSYIFQSSELFALSTAHQGGKASPQSVVGKEA